MLPLLVWFLSAALCLIISSIYVVYAANWSWYFAAYMCIDFIISNAHSYNGWPIIALISERSTFANT
jgi:hypothetical protein